VFPTEYEAVVALNQLLSHGELMEKSKGEPSRARAPGWRKNSAMLNAADSLRLLADAACCGREIASRNSGDDAAAALAELGGPVAVSASKGRCTLGASWDWCAWLELTIGARHSPNRSRR
jgi:hypothetical protein